MEVKSEPQKEDTQCMTSAEENTRNEKSQEEGQGSKEGEEEVVQEWSDEDLARMLMRQHVREKGEEPQRVDELASKAEGDEEEQDCGFYLTPPTKWQLGMTGMQREVLSMEFAMRDKVGENEWEEVAGAAGTDPYEARAYFEGSRAKLKAILKRSRASIRVEANGASASASESLNQLKVSDVRRLLIAPDGSLADQSQQGGLRVVHLAPKVRRHQPRELFLNVLLATPPDATALAFSVANGILPHLAEWLRKSIREGRNSFGQLCLRCLKHLPVTADALRRNTSCAYAIAEACDRAGGWDVHQRALDVLATWNDILPWPTPSKPTEPKSFATPNRGKPGQHSINKARQAPMGKESIGQHIGKPKGGVGAGAFAIGRRPTPKQAPSGGGKAQKPRWPAPKLVPLPGQKPIGKGEYSTERQGLELLGIEAESDGESPAEPDPHQLENEEALVSNSIVPEIPLIPLELQEPAI